jgi:hypothetical protein
LPTSSDGRTLQTIDAEFHPGPALEVFERHGVKFVVIGGLAGVLHGSSYATYDLDLAYERSNENLERLAAALRELGATLRGAPKDLPFQLDARTLAAGQNFTFDTRLGKVDMLGDPSGAPKYPKLAEDAEPKEIEGISVLVCSIDHLIAMKDAAGRTKDKLMATEYRVLADEIRRREVEG